MDRHADDTVIEAKLAKADAEVRANTAEMELAELRSAKEQSDAVIRKRNNIDAKAAIHAAIQRGAILPRDLRTQEDFERKATADPKFIQIIGDLPGNGLFRTDGGGRNRLSPVPTEAERIRVATGA